MKTDFFKEMKNYIIEGFKDRSDFIQYIRYYETLLQNKEKLKPILDDCCNWRMNIYHDEDNTGGYTYGKFIIKLWDFDGQEPDGLDDYTYDYKEKYPDYYYEIELERDERYWGYCTCTPDMKDYNPKYKCTGHGCDWVAPAFRLNKIESTRANFLGDEADLWKLEEKWSEYLDTYNEKIKQEKLKRLEEQMERLKKEQEELLK